MAYRGCHAGHCLLHLFPGLLPTVNAHYAQRRNLSAVAPSRHVTFEPSHDFTPLTNHIFVKNLHLLYPGIQVQLVGIPYQRDCQYWMLEIARLLLKYQITVCGASPDILLTILVQKRPCLCCNTKRSSSYI